MGFVWGWLIVLIGRDLPGNRPIRNLLAILLATMMAGSQIYSLADGIHLLLFLLTAVIAFIVHLSWRYSLRQRVR